MKGYIFYDDIQIKSGKHTVCLSYGSVLDRDEIYYGMKVNLLKPWTEKEERFNTLTEASQKYHELIEYFKSGRETVEEYFK